MERLTVKRDKPSINSQYTKKEKVWTADCIEKMGKYEDAEEKGLLLRLPCKIGDKLYAVEEWLDTGKLSVLEYTFNGVERGGYRLMYADNEEDITVFGFDEIGKTVFLTKEEAEQALAEMKGV